MRIVAISDLHTYLPKDLPKGDILVICGDITLSARHDYLEQAQFLNRTFKLWLQTVGADFKTIIGIAGNHDVVYENRPTMVNKLPWIYLQDSGCEVNGLKFWGCPWTKPFCNWGFNAEESFRQTLFNKIPVGTDIVLLHGPPYNIGLLDFAYGEHLGDPILLEHIKRIGSKYVFCGHIHSGSGHEVKIGNTTIANVCYVDEDYQPIKKIYSFDI
jgi:Icc-related predicted phosphoesterase